MSGREDTRLVDHLYGELSEKESREYRRALEQDPALASEAEALENLEETLGSMRMLEAEDPSPHLDSLILAHARQEADKLAESEKGFVAFVRRALRSRITAAAFVGSLAAIAAVVTVSKTAMLSLDESAPPSPSVTSIPVVAAKIEAEKEATLEEAPVANEVAQQPQQPQEQKERQERLDRAREGELRREPSSGESVQHARRSRSEPRVTAVETPKPADKKPEEPPPVATVPESAAAGDSFDDGLAANRGPMQAQGDRPTFGASTGGTKDNAARGEDLKAEITESKSAKPAKPAKQEPSTPAEADAAPKAAEKLQFETPPEPAREAARDELAKTTAPAKKTPPAKTPSVDKTKEKRADEFQAMDPQNAAVWAQNVISAAESQLAQKDSVGARRILRNGLERTKGTPAYGDLALRLAQLDFAEHRLADAAYNARLAANTPEFSRRHVALDLLERAERDAQSVQAASRAKQAAPKAASKADTAEKPAADVAK